MLIPVSAGFPYRLGRLKPRASTSRGPLVKVYNIFCHCHKPFLHMLPFCNFPCTPFQNNKANKSTLKLISVLIVSFRRSGEIDKLKKTRCCQISNFELRNLKHSSSSSASLNFVQNTLLSSSIHKDGNWEEGPRR